MPSDHTSHSYLHRVTLTPELETALAARLDHVSSEIIAALAGSTQWRYLEGKDFYAPSPSAIACLRAELATRRRAIIEEYALGLKGDRCPVSSLSQQLSSLSQQLSCSPATATHDIDQILSTPFLATPRPSARLKASRSLTNARRSLRHSTPRVYQALARLGIIERKSPPRPPLPALTAGSLSNLTVLLGYRDVVSPEETLRYAQRIVQSLGAQNTNIACLPLPPFVRAQTTLFSSGRHHIDVSPSVLADLKYFALGSRSWDAQSAFATIIHETLHALSPCRGDSVLAICHRAAGEQRFPEHFDMVEEGLVEWQTQQVMLSLCRTVLSRRGYQGAVAVVDNLWRTQGPEALTALWLATTPAQRMATYARLTNAQADIKPQIHTQRHN